MNLLILFYYIRTAKGYFLPLQDPIPTNTNNCPCGITCFVTNPDCQPCFGSNCMAARPRSPPIVQLPQGALADYPQYNPQPLLRLTQTYDLLTPPPPMSIPVLKQPALIMAREPHTEPNWSIPPLYALVQVPPSDTRTESNGRPAVERLFLEEAKTSEPLIQLHVAEATSTSTSPLEESTTVNATTYTSTTSAPLAIPVDESDVELFNHEQMSNTTGTTSMYPTTQDLEDEQPFSPTLELDLEGARTATTTTMDPIEGLLAAWADTTTANNLVAVTSELTGVHREGNEQQHDSDDASIGLNTIDTRIKSEVTTSLQPVSEKPVELERNDIELFQTTHSIRDYFGTTPRVIPSTTASDISNEIETMSAPVNQPIAPAFVPSEDDISGPLSEDRPQPSFRMQMPTAPPCANKETLTVFTGYKTAAATASSTNGTIRGHSFSKPTKLRDELGKRFYRKHRESGTVGKQQQVASGGETAHKARGTSKQLRQQMGTSLFRYKAKTRPKCNSVELKRLMQERMTLSTSASKQMVFSGARLMYPGRIVNVICSRHSFSYIVVTSPVYCEHRKGHLTCFTFLQP